MGGMTEKFMIYLFRKFSVIGFYNKFLRAKGFISGKVRKTIVMTFVNESCFATVLSCTVNGFPSGIHTVMTFALKKQKRLCRRTVLCGQ